MLSLGDQVQRLQASNSFGDQLRTVLEGIRKVTEQHMHIQASLEHKRTILSQLALLSHIMTSQYPRTTKSSKQSHEPPLVQCTVHSQYGVCGEHLLNVTLQRSPLCRFTEGWTFIVTVSGSCRSSISQSTVSAAMYQPSSLLSQCQHPKVTQTKRPWSVSKSRPINIRIPSADTVLQVQLPDDVLCLLPLTVQPVLIYSQCHSGTADARTLKHASVCLWPHTFDLLSLLSPSTTSLLPPKITREQQILQLTKCYRRFADVDRNIKPAPSLPPSVMSFVFQPKSLTSSADSGKPIEIPVWLFMGQIYTLVK